MPLALGCWAGNQTGLQKTGRKLPRSDCLGFTLFGNSTTFLPAARADFVASSQARLTTTPAGASTAPIGGYTQISQWLENSPKDNVTVSFSGALALANDAEKAPRAVSLPVGTANAGNFPEATSPPCPSL